MRYKVHSNAIHQVVSRPNELYHVPTYTDTHSDTDTYEVYFELTLVLILL